MKAIVCDFCNETVVESNRRAMVYSLSLDEAEDYVARSNDEKRPLMDCPHLCSLCGNAAKNALVEVRRIRRRARADGKAAGR